MAGDGRADDLRHRDVVEGHAVRGNGTITLVHKDDLRVGGVRQAEAVEVVDPLGVRLGAVGPGQSDDVFEGCPVVHAHLNDVPEIVLVAPLAVGEAEHHTGLARQIDMKGQCLERGDCIFGGVIHRDMVTATVRPVVRRDLDAALHRSQDLPRVAEGAALPILKEGIGGRDDDAELGGVAVLERLAAASVTILIHRGEAGPVIRDVRPDDHRVRAAGDL